MPLSHSNAPRQTSASSTASSVRQSSPDTARQPPRPPCLPEPTTAFTTCDLRRLLCPRQPSQSPRYPRPSISTSTSTSPSPVHPHPLPHLGNLPPWQNEMAPMKTLNSNYSSSNYGEDIARQANVLASCYVVDHTGSLKGLHYCTTLAAGKNENRPQQSSMTADAVPRGGVVFLRSPSQDYHPLRQVPPSRHSPPPTSLPSSRSPSVTPTPTAPAPATAILVADEGGRHFASGKNVRDSFARP